MNVQHILCEMQTLESGLTPHARCAFPHAVHTLGITNWMQWSCLEKRLSPNRLWGLEALCEGRDTNLSPFPVPWEFCFISHRVSAQMQPGPFACKRRAEPFSSGIRGAGRHGGSACQSLGVMGEGSFIPAQDFNNHALAQGQLSSADQGDGARAGRKMY